MDLSSRELIDVGLDAVGADAPAIAPALRGRVMDAVYAHHRPAWPDDGDGLTAQAAFLRTAAELGQLLDSLTAEDWSSVTAVEGSTVRDLVVHLVGVERYVLGQLGRGVVFHAPGRADHYPVTRGAAADLADADGQEISRVWWLDAMALVAASSELGPDQPVTFHHLSGTLGGLLVVRTFELWTHEDDIRRATGRPLNNLDDARLSLMSGQLMDLVARGMELMGTARPGRTARFELTGLGAGTFHIALAPDQAAGPPDVTIRVSAVELCRLAANRISATDLPVDVEGDRSLLEPVLVGAGAFALD